MIELITGLPGNGKSLYAITRTKALAEKESRPVYYSGITDCMVPGWIECDPTRWMELPKGSIIIIDEVQRVMRPRQHGSTVPEFVAGLETHRHLGVDLVLVTQHPMLLDTNVRRLVGRHLHIVRKFGTHQAVAHEWNAVKETCDKNREGSIQHHWSFPKEGFALYKSAELHTHKRRIPPRVWFLISLPFIIAGLVWYTYGRLMHKPKAPIVDAFTGATAASGAAAGPPGAARLSVPEYLKAQVPRVDGLAYTAPVYDEITKPVVAPYPAACVSMAGACKCYTQQGTFLQTPEYLCRQVVAGGFFVAWAQPTPAPAAAPRSEPARPVEVNSPPAFTSIGWTRPTTIPAETVLDRDPTQPGGRGKALPPVASPPKGP